MAGDMGYCTVRNLRPKLSDAGYVAYVRVAERADALLAHTRAHKMISYKLLKKTILKH
jgi:hypothetical protein